MEVILHPFLGGIFVASEQQIFASTFKRYTNFLPWKDTWLLSSITT
jgi:hypothetical protein